MYSNSLNIKITGNLSLAKVMELAGIESMHLVFFYLAVNKLMKEKKIFI